MRGIKFHGVFEVHDNARVGFRVPRVNVGDVGRAVRALALLNDLAFDFRRFVIRSFARIRDFL